MWKHSVFDRIGDCSDHGLRQSTAVATCLWHLAVGFNCTFDIDMENWPFIDDLPIIEKTVIFHSYVKVPKCTHSLNTLKNEEDHGYRPTLSPSVPLWYHDWSHHPVLDVLILGPIWVCLDIYYDRVPQNLMDWIKLIIHPTIYIYTHVLIYIYITLYHYEILWVSQYHG